jgi:hypothetical protein
LAVVERLKSDIRKGINQLNDPNTETGVLKMLEPSHPLPVEFDSSLERFNRMIADTSSRVPKSDVVDQINRDVSLYQKDRTG